MTPAQRPLARLLAGAVGALILSLPLVVAAQTPPEDGRPLPPANVTVSPTPPAGVAPQPAERAARRGVVVLAFGLGVVAAFSVFALSGFFKRKES